MTDSSSLLEEMKGLSPQAKAWLLEAAKSEQPATETQQAFWRMMTHQRIATLLAAVEFYEDLSPEARTWLRKADKDKIDQLNSTLDFTHASKIIWKFIWVGGGMVVAAFVGFSSLWKTFGEYITVKFK